ncbi:MAG: lamin tail domain-containing protein [Bacteroidales bacterium]|jgi:hypothetical protein|nr:lamin tail domain-containing protein [Bacteroidales bacterium]
MKKVILVVLLLLLHATDRNVSGFGTSVLSKRVSYPDRYINSREIHRESGTGKDNPQTTLPFHRRQTEAPVHGQFLIPPMRGEVIITEVMADPSPSVMLPEEEYIEICNRSATSVDLSGWTLRTDSQGAVFGDISIGAGQYIIVCAISDTAIFRPFGKVAGLRSFPALTDGGRLLYLCDDEGNMIHGVGYRPSWYNNDLKEGGGWSLEMIDKDHPFNTDGNWRASSSHKGGTPGSRNSVERSLPDLMFQGIVNACPSDSVTIFVRFSETIADPDLLSGNILLDGKNVNPVLQADPMLTLFEVKTGDPLQYGRVVNLTAGDGIKDFSGNPMLRNSFLTGLPERALEGDVIINEILFNPLPGDPDYIELLNVSEKILDASQILLATVNDATGDTSSAIAFYHEPYPVVPGSCFVITEDRDKVLLRYTSSEEQYIHEVSSMPSLPDAGGHLILLSRQLEIIDDVVYSDDMHYPLLSGNEGISLERVAGTAVFPASAQWHSASEDAGWGTPGAENSMAVMEPVLTDEVNISSTRITPDNDGFEDDVQVSLRLAGTGNVVSMEVFDETGSFVKRVAENLYTGQEATLVWDATSGGGSLVNTGIYVLFITVFNEQGKSIKVKKACAVIR